jgi:putative transcriptional regulator
MLDMPIQNRLKILIAEKELREQRKLSYRTVEKESNVPLSVLAGYANQRVNRFDGETLEKLCRYFDCQPGDLLIYADDLHDEDGEQ